MYTVQAQDRSGCPEYSVLATSHRLLTVLTAAGGVFLLVGTGTTCLYLVPILLN